MDILFPFYVKAKPVIILWYASYRFLSAVIQFSLLDISTMICVKD